MQKQLIFLVLLFSSQLFAAWEVNESFYEVPKTTNKEAIQKALFNDVNTRNYLLSYDLTEFSSVKVTSYQMLIQTVQWHNDEQCTIQSPVEITNMVVNVEAEFMLSGFENIKKYVYQSKLTTPCNENYKVNK